MSKLVQDLEDGLLSQPGKKAAVDKIADQVAELPAGHPSRERLAGDIGRMRQFHKLGELISLSTAVPDPVVPILQGTQAMGLPVPSSGRNRVREAIEAADKKKELSKLLNSLGNSKP